MACGCLAYRVPHACDLVLGQQIPAPPPPLKKSAGLMIGDFFSPQIRDSPFFHELGISPWKATTTFSPGLRTSSNAEWGNPRENSSGGGSPSVIQKMNLLEWLEMGYMYKYLNYKYYVLHIWYLLGIWHTIGILGKSVLGAVTPMVAPRGLT